MIDVLGLFVDMSPSFYRQEVALECLPTGTKGRASAESPLALGGWPWVWLILKAAAISFLFFLSKHSPFYLLVYAFRTV